MIFYEPNERDRKLFPHDPFKALVAPRPIGWVSTMSAKGELNLAPYSYFNAFSSNPPIVGFSSEGDKDSSTFSTRSIEAARLTSDEASRWNCSGCPARQSNAVTSISYISPSRTPAAK